MMSRHRSRLPVAVTLATLVVAVAGCSADKTPNQTATAQLRDSGDHVCLLLPEGVFAPLLATDHVEVKAGGLKSLESGWCEFSAAGVEGDAPSLGGTVRVRSGSEAYNLMREGEEGASRSSQVRSLSAALGQGSAYRLDRVGDFVVWSLFSCDGKNRTLWIAIIGASAERPHLLADATRLMRFAQERYARLARCTIEQPSAATAPPSAPPSPSPSP